MHSPGNELEIANTYYLYVQLIFMRKIIFLGIILLPLFISHSCTHEPTLPEEQVSYQNDIYPIILSSCMHSGCHDTLGDEAFPMINYSFLVSHDRVVPGKPKKSSLYTSVTTAYGEDFMPRFPYSPLSERQIKMLYIWIAQGAKDN